MARRDPPATNLSRNRVVAKQPTKITNPSGPPADNLSRTNLSRQRVLPPHLTATNSWGKAVPRTSISEYYARVASEDQQENPATTKIDAELNKDKIKNDGDGDYDYFDESAELRRINKLNDYLLDEASDIESVVRRIDIKERLQALRSSQRGISFGENEPTNHKKEHTLSQDEEDNLSIVEEGAEDDGCINELWPWCGAESKKAHTLSQDDCEAFGKKKHTNNNDKETDKDTASTAASNKAKSSTAKSERDDENNDMYKDMDGIVPMEDLDELDLTNHTSKAATGDGGCCYAPPSPHVLVSGFFCTLVEFLTCSATSGGEMLIEATKGTSPPLLPPPLPLTPESSEGTPPPTPKLRYEMPLQSVQDDDNIYSWGMGSTSREQESASPNNIARAINFSSKRLDEEKRGIALYDRNDIRHAVQRVEVAEEYDDYENYDDDDDDDDDEEDRDEAQDEFSYGQYEDVPQAIIVKPKKVDDVSILDITSIDSLEDLRNKQAWSLSPRRKRRLRALAKAEAVGRQAT